MWHGALPQLPRKTTICRLPVRGWHIAVLPLVATFCMTDSLNFRLLFESAPGAYLVVDPSFRIVAVTDSYLAATSLQRDALLGQDLFEVIPRNNDDADGEGARNLRSSLETVLRTGAKHLMAVQKYHVARNDAEGAGYEEHYWKPVNTPVLVDGRTAYVIHTIEHVSDFVRLEQLEGENEQATSQLSTLREADRAKDEFIAIISHELRTPMTSILGWTRMLALGKLDEETHTEALEALERSTLAQAKLIEDLLDESRIASGKLRLELRSLDLRTVVKSAVSMARPTASAKGIELSAECGETPCEVYGDPARLQQAIGNLLGNAMKFTPEGGKVLVRLGCDGAEVSIEVVDNGQGIDPELLPHMFDRFRQGEGQSAERQSGLGLGLSITRHVVEMHGGSVVAATAGPGKGSTFTIKLPLHSSENVANDIVGRDSIARVRDLPSLVGVRVLIVEDEVDNRKVIAASLRQGGAEVECVGTAGAGFDMHESWKPDVIICDVGLPDLDGCAFIAEVRSREAATGSNTPALALTVLGRPGEQARITEAGFNVFRQKPIDPVDLAHEIKRLVQNQQSAPAPILT